MKRRIISFFLLAVTCLCVLITPAIAEQQDYKLQMETEKDVYYRGDTFTADIKAAEAGVTANLGFYSFQLSFDTDKLTLEKLEAEKTIGGESYVNGTKIDWIHKDGVGLDLGNGTVIAKATFEVKDSAVYGDTDLDFVSSFTELDAINSINSSVQAVGKTITIKKLNTVSGQIKSWNPNNGFTVALKQDGVTKYSAAVEGTKTGSGQLTQSFAVTGVADGTYDLVVSKQCHLDYTVKGVVVNGADIDLTAAASTKQYKLITMLVGDVDENARINETDVSIVRYDTNINHTTDSAVNPIADVNGDGRVNETDVSIIRYEIHINKTANDCTFNY